MLAGLQEQRQRITRRRSADQATAVDQERAEPVDDTGHLVAPPAQMRRRDGTDGAVGGGAGQDRPDPARPAMSGPPGEGDHLGRRSLARDLGDRLHPVERDRSVRVTAGADGDHPPADAPAGEGHPHHRPDPHLAPERVRDQVVELLVDARDVREDPRHQRWALRTGGHNPQAALNASTRSACSHVKSASGRPKWP